MRKRNWINILFWILFSAAAAFTLHRTATEKIEQRISLFVGAAALWINLYPRFIQSSDLRCAVNTVTILRIPSGNQQSVLIDIALNDLFSGSPSAAAVKLMNNIAGIHEAIRSNNKQYVRNWLSTTDLSSGLYLPSDDLIVKFLRDIRTTPTFFIPLFIYNAGAKHAEIGPVSMIAELTSDRTQRWAYGASLEVNESKLIHFGKKDHDMDKISGLFSGYIVKPNDTIKLNLYFIPYHDALGKKLTNTGLEPGTYDLHIQGFDRNERPAFKTILKGYPLKEDTMLASFKNGQWTYQAGIGNCIQKLMKSATSKL